MNLFLAEASQLVSEGGLDNLGGYSLAVRAAEDLPVTRVDPLIQATGGVAAAGYSAVCSATWILGRRRARLERVSWEAVLVWRLRWSEKGLPDEDSVTTGGECRFRQRTTSAGELDASVDDVRGSCEIKNLAAVQKSWGGIWQWCPDFRRITSWTPCGPRGVRGLGSQGTGLPEEIPRIRDSSDRRERAEGERRFAPSAYVAWPEWK